MSNKITIPEVFPSDQSLPFTREGFDHIEELIERYGKEFTKGQIIEMYKISAMRQQADAFTVISVVLKDIQESLSDIRNELSSLYLSTLDSNEEE